MKVRARHLENMVFLVYAEGHHRQLLEFADRQVGVSAIADSGAS